MYETTLLCVRTLKTMPKHISTACVQRFNNTVRTLLQCQSPCRTIPKHTYKPNVRSKNTSQFTPTRNALLIRYMYSNTFTLRVSLSQQLVQLFSLSLLKTFIMAHLFKQMYLEDITDIKNQFTPEELTTAITTELIKRKIDELQRQKEIPISNTKTN